MAVPASSRERAFSRALDRQPRFERGNVVLHDTAANLFHRDPFGLDRRVAVRIVMLAQAGPCPTAQLLGAHRSHVHKQESIRDGWRRHLGEGGRVEVGLLVGVRRSSAISG